MRRVDLGGYTLSDDDGFVILKRSELAMLIEAINCARNLLEALNLLRGCELFTTQKIQWNTRLIDNYIDTFHRASDLSEAHAAYEKFEPTRWW